MEKRTITIIAVLIIALLAINIVSAEFWSCFNKGDVVNYCNNYKPPKTCTLSNICQWCMSVYNETENCYVHGAWPKCNQLSPECSAGGGGTIDTIAPELNLISPVENHVYTSRSVPFEFSLNEEADVYYLDLIGGRGKWTKICENCLGDNGKRSFRVGVNNLTIKAEDGIGNVAYKNISFFVDSQKPVISKISPANGFIGVNNLFEIKFKEENPEKVILYYGDENYELDIGNECYYEREKYYCETSLDLTGFNNQEIEYYFYVEDIAGNSKDSAKRSLDVDTSFPVVNNPSSFWTQDGRYIYFNLSVTEDNFDEASYSYIDSNGIVREKRLCSRLKNGMCSIKKIFNSGHYDLTINVLDEAGNSIGIPVSFDIN